ncbi:hypothetical protein BJI69_20335 [Luteibacter rhizovicinus DSM 16549]|uniref:Uncharacterized protein n=1 Tax=Luteibacter rhizovicinus DSM 16549 TaxID=1440763 RepID=A0A0G9H0A5_9GAMM|nr:hypothetical protein BJI69_20335 [Luteibacter rhizovicinus DSM 16549]KLD62941.1 hypothetical protein Y883_20090 [Luteibacter rhizovicinus DSM 16549]
MGCGIGTVVSIAFFQRFIVASYTLRLLGDLNQDVAMLNAVHSSKTDLSEHLAKMRLSSTLKGLEAQWPSMTEPSRESASRTMQKATGKDPNVDDTIARMLTAPAPPAP